MVFDVQTIVCVRECVCISMYSCFNMLLLRAFVRFPLIQLHNYSYTDILFAFFSYFYSIYMDVTCKAIEACTHTHTHTPVRQSRVRWIHNGTTIFCCSIPFHLYCLCALLLFLRLARTQWYVKIGCACEWERIHAYTIHYVHWQNEYKKSFTFNFSSFQFSFLR